MSPLRRAFLFEDLEMADTQAQETATEETTTSQSEEQIEQTEEQAEASFEAGFKKARSGEDSDQAEDIDPDVDPAKQTADATTAADTTTQEDASDSDTTDGGDKTGSDQTQQQVADEAAGSLIAGMPEDQVKALLAQAGSLPELKDAIAKEFRKVYGRLGSLNSQSSKLTPDSLKRLKENYPDIAADLAADLADSLQAGGGSTLDEEQIQQLISNPVNKKLAELDQRDHERDQKFEKRLLKRYEPNWEKIVTSPDYTLWLQQQEAEYRQTIDNSWNADEIYDSILLFKAHADAQASKDEAAERERKRKEEEDKQRRSTSNQRRLRGNIQPKGTGEEPETGISDEAAFVRGFKKARSGAQA